MPKLDCTIETSMEEMTMSRCHTSKLLTVLMLATIGHAYAQAWPTKPVTILVPFPAGGTTDVLARSVSSRLTTAIGQTVIVDNRPGAGSTLGAELAAKAVPDGHTILMGAVHHTVATNVYKNLRYSFEKDFAPLTTVALVPNVLTVSAKSSYKSVKDIIAAAKANPDKLSYGSNGAGTAQHMIGTQFQIETGTQILHVPYKGSAPLTTDLVGGQVDMSFDTVTPVLPFIKDGRLRPLAVTTASRTPSLPNVPTLQEAGVANIAIGTWFGLLAPAATPKAVTAQLYTELSKIIASPEFRKQMAEIGAEPIGNRPEEMAKQIREETEKFARLVKLGKVTID
jgi:tripartite-type tricarboxylate transporter receptor subunit TctC